jgi:thioredoxin 2
LFGHALRSRSSDARQALAMSDHATATDSLLVVCPECATRNRVGRERLGDAPACGSCKQPLFPGRPFELTTANFDRHIGGDATVIVDFWAAWCGPCRMMAPAYEQAAQRLASEVRIAKLNTEEEPDIAGRFGIRGIPTMILFRGGREEKRVSGAMPAAEIAARFAL